MHGFVVVHIASTNPIFFYFISQVTLSDCKNCKGSRQGHHIPGGWFPNLVFQQTKDKAYPRWPSLCDWEHGEDQGGGEEEAPLHGEAWRLWDWGGEKRIILFIIVFKISSKVKDNANGKLVYHMERAGKWEKTAQKTHIFAWIPVRP